MTILTHFSHLFSSVSDVSHIRLLSHVRCKHVTYLSFTPFDNVRNFGIY